MYEQFAVYVPQTASESSGKNQRLRDLNRHKHGQHQHKHHTENGQPDGCEVERAVWMRLLRPLTIKWSLGSTDMQAMTTKRFKTMMRMLWANKPLLIISENYNEKPETKDKEPVQDLPATTYRPHIKGLDL